MQESVLAGLDDVRRSLGYAKSPMLERLLIGQVALAWLNYEATKQVYVKVAFEGSGMEPKHGPYWERRMVSVEKRYQRALESLARLRKVVRSTKKVQQEYGAGTAEGSDAGQDEGCGEALWDPLGDPLQTLREEAAAAREAADRERAKALAEEKALEEEGGWESSCAVLDAMVEKMGIKRVEIDWPEEDEMAEDVDGIGSVRPPATSWEEVKASIEDAAGSDEVTAPGDHGLKHVFDGRDDRRPRSGGTS
ncbi:MAG: hypothetical protein ACR2GR_03160 [Rhodothermales bacterium]